MTATDALRLEGVTKTFGAVTALREVSFDVSRGEIHALVGENGAGKSTLMDIAAGSVCPDRGRVEIGGHVLTRGSARAAESLGLVVVYQNPALINELTVLENLLLATPPEQRPGRGEQAAWARAQLERVALDVVLRERVIELSPGQRQLLEIAKALSQQPTVLVLDEPTESLGAADVKRLMDLTRELASQGTGIVYISHRIAEVRRIAHRITALRDGVITGSAPADAIDDDAIVEMIVGRSMAALFPAKSRVDDPAPTLVVEGLSGVGFHDVSLTVRRGDVVGLAGIEGNGQREFLRALAGLGPADKGRVTLHGQLLDLRSPQRAAAAGIRLTPADRLAEGLFPALTVRENIASGSLGAFSRGGFIRSGEERAAITGQMEATLVKAGSPESGVLTLSGGNQQKVMFAKAALADPQAVLCDDPTRGVDVGARSEIYGLLRHMSEAGHPVIVLSADAAELAGLCDTVAVFSRGVIVETLNGNLTEDAITGAALRATRGDTAHGACPGGEQDAPAPAGRRLRSRLLRSDSSPSAVLLILTVLVALLAAAQQPTLLSGPNVSLLLYGVAALAFIALGQQIVLLTGGIDLSVGPTAGLQVVVMSYVLAQGTTGSLIAGLLLSLAVTVLIGLVNGALIALGGISAIITTLGTYIALQGVSLLLRPEVGGLIDSGFIQTVSTAVGSVPVVFIVAVAAALSAEFVSRRTRFGYALRAVGPGRSAAERIGVRVRLTLVVAYMLCSVFTLLGAILLAAQIGTGDASAGLNYTLSSISAVVLGGASIFGGRGSFLGALTGALLLGLIANATTFLGLDQAWQYWVPGGIILLAAAVSARLRSTGIHKTRQTT
ncbi:ATP-binding cassette domain-containing protein [Streptomyces umbrinus]|uniref:ATP-binding cassette domain-containing protein n=1 Tax=Streptomyces umbrinus TaxID=67370 RepID=UPI003C3025D8